LEKCVVVLEDDPDLASLVRELLEDEGYNVLEVATPDELLAEAARRSPCVALVDSTNPSEFDLWELGPRLAKMGVPPVAFTAHASAQEQFQRDNHGFVGVVNKPFDADEFLQVVSQICWDDHKAVAS